MVSSIASGPSIDLSALPAPDVIAQPTFETRLAAKLAQLVTQAPEFTALVESDPAMKLLEADSYDETVLAQAFADASRGMLIAFATGPRLDHLAALYGVARLADETDTALRQRVQLAPHSFSVAGPELAYVYWARSADPDVADTTAVAPKPDDIRQLVLAVLAEHDAASELVSAMASALDEATWPGTVEVTVLSASGNGVPSSGVLAAVTEVLTGPVRPLTDEVIVQGATLVPFAIEAQLTVFAGPDQGLLLQTALDSLNAHLATARKLGRDVTRSGLIAALHVANVQKVELLSPVADIDIDASEIASVTDIDVTIAGTVI